MNLLFNNYDNARLVDMYPVLTNLVLFFIFYILLFIPKKEYYNNEILDMKFTDTIKGFCIINIIIGHLIIYVLPIGSNIIPFKLVGAFMVPIFLFLSGYGLTESFKNKGLEKFILKRLSKVIIPFFIMNAIWIILNSILLNINYSLTDIILGIIGIKLIDRNYWYIIYIIFWYIIYMLIFSTKLNEKQKVVLIWIVSITVFTLLKGNSNYRINSFNFSLGITVSIYKKQIIDALKRKSVFIFMLIISSVIIIFRRNLPQNSYLIKEPILHISAIFLVISILYLVNKNKYSTIYSFLGKISFELFLLHGAFLYSYDFILFKYPLFISTLIYIIIISLMAIVLNKAMQKINRVLTKGDLKLRRRLWAK